MYNIRRVLSRAGFPDLPLKERRRLSAGGRRPLWICRSGSGGTAGSRPGRRPHFLCGQEMGERSRRGLCPLDPRAASGWPAAKVGGALSRMNERAYSIPPGAAPRAQCLCRRVSGTESDVRSGRHGHFCAARSAHGEAENCAASPRTRARRANARNGRCFPPGGFAEPSGSRCWENGICHIKSGRPVGRPLFYEG